MADQTGWTPKKGAKFLTELGKHANVSAAVRAVGLSRARAYDLRKQDKEFAAGWAEAIDIGADALEAEARRRALTGVLRPVHQGGKKVGTIREYSDELLIFLLKGARPERYRQRFDHNVGGEHAIILNSTILARGRAKIEVMKKNAAPEDDGDSTPSRNGVSS